MPLYHLTKEEAAAARSALGQVYSTSKLEPEREELMKNAERKLDISESFVSDVTISAQQMQTALIKLREFNGPMSPGTLEGMSSGAVRLHHHGGIFAIDKLGTGRVVEEEDM